jgi:hypothetical protein
LPLWWQLAHFLSNKAAASMAGGLFVREHPVRPKSPAIEEMRMLRRIGRDTYLKWTAPTQRGCYIKDAVRAVDGHSDCVEKGKDSSRLALVLTSAFANCGVISGTQRR